jgi:flavin reductase (DIM6/NTAB) family NADH-FMN oxidoreductase RutF
MKTIAPKDISTSAFHAIMLGSIAPRPIAFVSSIDSKGQVNLSPFSFFNAFGSNPPIVIFSPARRVRDNTIKNTLENVMEVPEVVINIVNFDMVEQASLASTEYEKGINEFVKAGLTEVKSDLVRPPRVGESPVAFECKVNQIISTGEEGGAANLVICEIILAHVREDLLNEKGGIDPFKIDLVSRMGGDWYCRANGEALFEVEKPLVKKGIGVDLIPAPIRFSKVLTGNDLGKLGNVETLPTPSEIDMIRAMPEYQNILKREDDIETALHRWAQTYLHKNDIPTAWKILLTSVSL